MDDWSERLSAGDAAAFAELYDACADRLHHYLMFRLRSREDAADVLQETFVRLARSRRRLASVADPIAYVFAIARNEAARWMRRAAGERERRVLSGGMLYREACDDDMALRETAEAIAAAIGQLDDELAEVIDLKIYAGLTFAQIAEVTRLPQGTVATRYRRAIIQLRAMWIKERL